MKLSGIYCLILCLVLLRLPAISGEKEYKLFNQEKVDSLERLLLTQKEDAEKVAILSKLAELYYSKKNQQTINYGNEALRLSNKLSLPTDVFLLRILGNAYDKDGNTAKAIQIISEAISILEYENDSVQLGQAINYLAFLQYKNKEYFSSIENYNKALNFNLLYNRNIDLADTYYGLFQVNSVIGNTKEEVFYLDKFLFVADKTTDLKRIAKANLILGDINHEEKRFSEAFDYYSKAYEASELIEDSVYMALVINHIAWAYYQKGELKTSLEYYEKNLDLSIPLQGQNTTTNIYGNIGNIYRDWKDYDVALEYYEKSIALSKEIGDYYNLSWLYEDISRMYAENNNYQKAYDLYRLHSQYADSAMNQQYETRILDARARYEAEKNKNELEVLALKVQQNRIYNYIIIAGLIVLLIIVALYFQRNRARSQRRIMEMNHTISELNQQNLRQQMNPHFIFNTLNSIQYYVFQNDKMASNTYMSKFATLMRKTLDNSVHTAIPIKDELEALELYLELESLRFKEKFNWTIDLDEEIDTLLYKIPTMLIQPYVENSINHGLMNKEGKGYVNIHLNLSGEIIRCIVEDNGIGREKAMAIRDAKKENHRSRGTTITESRLKLVNEIYGKKMKIHYTDLTDGSGKPAGTRVEINIPIIT